MATATGSFSTGEAVRITGVSFRNIDYWARTKFIVPSIADAKGTGTERRYSFSDLLAVRKRATSRAVTIVLPKTPDGRHCDYAPALALLHERLSSAPVYQERGEPTEDDKARALEADVLARWQAARNAGTRAIDRVGRKPGALSRFR